MFWPLYRFVERLFCTQTVHLGLGAWPLYSNWPLSIRRWFHCNSTMHAAKGCNCTRTKLYTYNVQTNCYAMMETDGIGRIANEKVFIMVMCMRGKRLYLVRYFIFLEGETIHLSFDMDYGLEKRMILRGFKLNIKDSVCTQLNHPYKYK